MSKMNSSPLKRSAGSHVALVSVTYGPSSGTTALLPPSVPPSAASLVLPSSAQPASWLITAIVVIMPAVLARNSRRSMPCLRDSVSARSRISLRVSFSLGVASHQNSPLLRLPNHTGGSTGTSMPLFFCLLSQGNFLDMVRSRFQRLVITPTSRHVVSVLPSPV